MTRPPSPRGGGFLIALGTIGGAMAGAQAGEATIGFLSGLAAGVIAAVLVWLFDRRRTRLP